MIGDGMQLAHEVATSRYLFGEDFALAHHRLPESAFVTTWDVTSYDARAAQLGKPTWSSSSVDPKVGYDPELGGEAPYPLLEDNPTRVSYFLSGVAPDSAGTATAMSTGAKTDSTRIAWAPGGFPGGELLTNPAYLRERYGMAVGLVTTVPITHATPAAFYAHNTHRNNYLEIGHEILAHTRPDVIIGGGFAAPSYLAEKDVSDAKASNDWIVVERRPGVDGGVSLRAAADRAVVDGKGLFGLFGGLDGKFEYPVPSDTPGSPSIARGNIENPELADAVAAALRVLSANPNGFFTLIEQGDIDWANHNNDFASMIGCTHDLHKAVQAVVDFVDQPDDAIDWDNTTLLITADHANSYLRLIATLGPGDLPTQLGSTYPDGDVTYGTTGHTSELVTLRARGRAASRVLDYAIAYPGLPIVDNTAIHALTLDAVER
jgi:alkaline phosphatase